MIIPTITRTTNAIDKIEQELQNYQNEDQPVANEGELNEDKINQQLMVTRAMKTAVDSTSAFIRAQTRSNPVAGILDTLLNVQRNLDKMSDSFQDDIDHLKWKHKKLHYFNSQTSSLFNGSLNEPKLAMQGVLVLNNTFVNTTTGTYVLSVTMDKSWFTKLHADDYSALKAELAKENTTGQGYKLFAQGALWVDNNGQLHADGSAGANAYLANIKTQGDFEIAANTEALLGAKAGVSTGAGGELNRELSARDGHLKLELDVGFTVGIGAKVGVSFDVDYGQALEDIKSFDDWLNPFD